MNIRWYCIRGITAALALLMAAASAQNDTPGDWQLLGEGKSSSKSDDDKFAFSIKYNTRYEVQVDHDSTDDFSVMVRDEDKRELTRREGNRSIIARFDTNEVQGGKVYIHVISSGATGKYRVFTREGWSDDPLDRDLDGTYDLDFPNKPSYNGTATIRQTGSSFTIEGRQGTGARALTWSGNGNVSGDRVTFSYRTSKAERGEADLRRSASGSLSGTYNLGGKSRGDLVMRPTGSRAQRAGANNWLDVETPTKFAIGFGGDRGLSGNAEVTIRGSSATAKGENRRNGRTEISWEGTGTYDKMARLLKLNLNIKNHTKTKGFMELKLTRDGTLEGYYQVADGPRKRLVMTPK